MTLPPPISTLFPYTTLFRSPDVLDARHDFLPDIAPFVVADAALSDLGHRRCLIDIHAIERKPRFRTQDFPEDRKSTRLNSSHPSISYAVFCLKKKRRHVNHG